MRDFNEKPRIFSANAVCGYASAGTTATTLRLRPSW